MRVHNRARTVAADIDVDKDTIQSKPKRRIGTRVTQDQAVETLRGGGKCSSPDKTTEIASISAESEEVSIRGVVLSAGKRPITVDGERQIIVEGELRDESGCIPYTAWKNFDFGRGDTIHIKSAQVEKRHGTPVLNLQSHTAVMPVQQALPIPIGPRSVDPLTETTVGDRALTLEVRVIDAEERIIETRGRTQEVRTGILGDPSGRRPVTDWEARPELETGQTLRIENAYVQSFRGMPAVNLSRYSSVNRLDRSVHVAGLHRFRSIQEAITAGTSFDIEVDVTVVDLLDGSGLIERCPVCNRVMYNGSCRGHEDVEGVPDLRIKAVVDDGTGTARALFDRPTTETLYGREVEEAVIEARESMNRNAVSKRIAERLIGRPITLRGDLRAGPTGAQFAVRAYKEISPTPRREARALLRRAGGIA